LHRLLHESQTFVIELGLFKKYNSKAEGNSALMTRPDIFHVYGCWNK